MKRKLTIICLIIASVITAQESEKKSFSFTLQQAIDHAIENNYTAINAKRDIEAAKQKKWETTASGLPQITSNVQYLNNLDFQVQGVSGNAFNPGGDPNAITTIAFGTKHSMNASATLSQLIFDGSYIVGLQSAKVYLQISENAKEKTDLEIREMVTNAYGNVLLARESVLIFEKNKATLEKTLFETNETFKNGLTEEENVEQLQITLTQLTSSLSNAKKREEIALNLLKISMGIDINNEVILTEKLDDLATSNVDLAALNEQFDANNSIDFKIQKNNEESKRLLLKLERFRALPTIGAQLNYGANTFANRFDFLTTDQKWYNYSNFGVNISLPIFSSFRDRARTQQAKIVFEQAKTQVTETEQRLKLQYQQAKTDYEFSIEQYGASKSNLKLAERIEAKQQVKFKEGLSTSFEFTEAQRQLYTAQQNYLQAMIDVMNKKATLDKLTNKK
ncbi:TolC family protein [Flavobacterium cyclinae]|uniref:TolC family protein n=1 Tax=Flavobacterium cyclinae TaxID=2895947 RepID=UPI001E2D1965|nr:TolC family protein [Flavobacterium cyclinae]UGS21294.1 TolC family protein [Flavobacterium cyclinae]